MRVFLGLMVAAALGVGAWLLLRGGPENGLDLGETERAPAAEREGPELLGLEAGLRPGAKVPTGRVQLVVRVRRGDNPAQAEVQLTFLRAITSGQPDPQRGPEYTRRVVFGRPPAAPPIVAKRSTDEAGEVVFGGLAPGVYRIEARAADGARGSTLAAPALDGLRLAVDLRLAAPGAAFEGRVEWSDGEPFEGELAASPLPPLESPRGTSYRTGTDGAYTTIRAGVFRLEGLGEGRFQVKVRVGDDLLASCPAVTLPQEEPFKLVVVRPTRELLGRVLVEGQEVPIPVAEISAAALWDTGRATVPETRTTSDGEGRFRLRLPPGPAYVTAEAVGFTARTLEVALDAKEVTFRLRRAGGLRGQVLSAVDATPAPGAIVFATSRDGSTANAITDRHGRYTIEELAVGEATAFVRGGGWISPELGRLPEGGYNPLAVEIVSGAQVTMDLRAERAGSLRGRVLDATGLPVTGAVVLVRPESSSQVGGGEGSPATTGPDGSFHLEDLGVGTNVTLDVSSLEHAPTRSGPHAVQAEAPVAIEIRLGAPCWVDVLVLEKASETPVPNARVGLQRKELVGDRRTFTEEASAVSGTDGRVRLGPVSPGSFRARAYGTNGYHREVLIEVEGTSEGASATKVTLRLSPSMPIEGRVDLPDGTPAAGACLKQEDSWQGCTTGIDGHFLLLVEGPHEITLCADLVAADGTRLTATRKAAPGTKDLVLCLAPDERPSTSLIVRVTDTNGRPVPRVLVTLETKSETWGQDVEAGQARFDLGAADASNLQEIARGTAYVSATDPRDDSDVPLPLGPGRVGPLTKDQRLIEMRMPAERVILGRVLGPSGRPLRGVLVRAIYVDPTAQDPRERKTQVSQGRSDADGRFRVGGLGEGLHRLQALGPPNLLAPVLDPVRSGSSDVLLRFREGATARVRVTDAEGKPFPLAQVSAARMGRTLDDDERPPGWRTDGSERTLVPTGPDGVALLEGLDGERAYVLRVEAPELASSIAHEQRDWRPADLAVQLERGYTVAGVVRDPEGRPVAKAHVYRALPDKHWGTSTTDAQGRFRFPNLHAGPVVLRAAPPGDSVDWQREGAPELTVAAGTENVVLTVDPGLELLVEAVVPAGLASPRTHAQLNRLREDGQTEPAGHALFEAGRVRFLGLRANTRYSVWVAPQGDDLYGWLPDVRAGSSVKMHLERGQSIRGKLSAPTGASNLTVHASDGLGRDAQAQVAADGTFEIKGMPPGRWTVTAGWITEEEWWGASGKVDAGGTVDLVLQPMIR